MCCCRSSRLSPFSRKNLPLSNAPQSPISQSRACIRAPENNRCDRPRLTRRAVVFLTGQGLQEVSMNKRYFATLASLLLGASFAFGQAQVAPPATAPDTVPAPAPDFSCMTSIWNEIRSTICGDDNGKTSRLFSVNAEYMLWFFANSSDTTVVAATAPLTVPGAETIGFVADAEHANPNKAPPISGAAHDLCLLANRGGCLDSSWRPRLQRGGCHLCRRANERQSHRW